MNIRPAYTFDDVLLVPQHSAVASRDNIDLGVDLGKGIQLEFPIVSANMKTVTGADMAAVMLRYGCFPILHRFDEKGSLSLLNGTIAAAKKQGTVNVHERLRLAVSVGVHQRDRVGFSHLMDSYVESGHTRYGHEVISSVCVDVAHGDHALCIEMVEWIAKKYPDLLLVAGNVATSAGARRLVNAGADVVKVGVGPGCFAAGTRILMSNATYKNIEDVNPGDRVINQDGKPVTVTNAFSTGIRRIYKLRHTLAHKDTLVTGDHKFWVGDLNSVSKSTISNQGYVKVLEAKSKTTPMSSKYKWKTIGSVEQDCLLFPRRIEFELEKYFKIELYKRCGGNGISVVKNELDVVIEPSYEIGYIFGTFLGDGCAMCAESNGSHIGSVRWYFGSKENDIAQKLSSAIEKVFGKRPKLKTTSNLLMVSFYYKPFADFLWRFGKKQRKCLPPEYLIDDKDYLRGLLDGLIDSDGNIEKGGRVVFTNTSEQLIELFGIVTYMLTGVMPNMRMKPASVGGLDANIVNCHDGYAGRINTTGTKRLASDYQVAKLLELTETDNEVDVFDISVDCPTHSFVANNAIVHNSICSTRIETGNGVPQLTALEDIYNAVGKKAKIIADGGIRSAGDCVKALCFSHAVMLGNLLAGTDEAPGTTTICDGKKYKTYVGSSTHKHKHVEGVAALVPYKGPAASVIAKLRDGITSGLSYQGVYNLKELRDEPEFVLVSNAGIVESRPHDVLL